MLWGIPWINIQLMLDDAARTTDDDPDGGDSGNVEERKLTTKEDIINYINGMM